MAFYIVLIFVVILVLSLIPKILPGISKRVVNLSVQDSDREKELRKELKSLKEELHNVNMVDEFAKHARLERKMNALKDEISKITKSKSEVFLKLKLGTNVIFQIVQVAIMLVMIWSLRYQPLMSLPTQWLWPLNTVIAFPSGVSGGIGITCWIIVCKSVTRQVSDIMTS